MSGSVSIIPVPKTIGKHEVILHEGEIMANPASTKRNIYGPAKVVVDVFPDGTDVQVLRPKTT